MNLMILFLFLYLRLFEGRRSAHRTT